MVGEAITLKADKTEFLAIFAEHNTEKAMGGVIVLHGIGVHPAWPEVIQPLRTQLPDHGWASLSLQMPILPNEAKSEEYAPLFNEVIPRIQAGVDHLKIWAFKILLLLPIAWAHLWPHTTWQKNLTRQLPLLLGLV